MLYKCTYKHCKIRMVVNDNSRIGDQQKIYTQIELHENCNLHRLRYLCVYVGISICAVPLVFIVDIYHFYIEYSLFLAALMSTQMTLLLATSNHNHSSCCYDHFLSFNSRLVTYWSVEVVRGEPSVRLIFVAGRKLWLLCHLILIEVCIIG